VASLYTVSTLLVKSTRRANARRRRDCLDCFSVTGVGVTPSHRSITPLSKVHVHASRCPGGVFVWIVGPLGRAVSKAAHRLSTRTSPQVARLGPISETVSPAADHRMCGGLFPPGPVVQRGDAATINSVRESEGRTAKPLEARSLESRAESIVQTRSCVEGPGDWASKRSAHKPALLHHPNR
jgi:hypothetical protein